MNPALSISANLTILLLAVIVQISCAQNAIEPYFPGLAEGTKVSESCSSYQDYSINLTEIDGDQQFSLFQSTNCKGEKVYSVTLGIEASLAGIWQNLLVFDEGTDVNGHELRLVSVTNSEEFFTLAFEGVAPGFENKKITYFAPSEQIATESQCNPLGINFKDLKDNSTEVLIGPKFEFLAETKKTVPVKGQYTCYAAQ